MASETTTREQTSGEQFARKWVPLFSFPFDEERIIAFIEDRNGRAQLTCAVNALPELIATIEKLDAERDRWLESEKDVRTYELRLIERMIELGVVARYPCDFYRYVEGALAALETLHKADAPDAPLPAEASPDRATWLASWPSSCRACDGWGVTTTSQSVPYGSTSASFDVTDPCEACTNKGICARCGKPGLSDEDRGDEETGNGPCAFCAWNYDDGAPPGEELETAPKICLNCNHATPHDEEPEYFDSVTPPPGILVCGWRRTDAGGVNFAFVCPCGMPDFGEQEVTRA